MAPWVLPFALVAALTGDGGQAKKEEDPVDQVQAKVCAVLAKLDPNPADRKQAEESLRQELYRIVDTDIAKLRPEKGSSTFASSDRRFLLVIAANNITGANGYNAEAQDDKALIVLAVAGDGGPEQGNEIRPGFGGGAEASAKNGIAIALGGRGGFGGGGGGGSQAEGAIGAIGLGGEGGKAPGGGSKGGRGGSSGIDNPAAIVQALKKLNKP
jgi:hypothetical protein